MQEIIALLYTSHTSYSLFYNEVIKLRVHLSISN